MCSGLQIYTMSTPGNAGFSSWYEQKCIQDVIRIQATKKLRSGFSNRIYIRSFHIIIGFKGMVYIFENSRNNSHFLKIKNTTNPNAQSTNFYICLAVSFLSQEVHCRKLGACWRRLVILLYQRCYIVCTVVRLN